jgi:ATP-dependent Clp protease ATP-binding subunit ClpC
VHRIRFERMTDTVKEEMQKVFNPEFLNRLDDVIVFHPLDRGAHRADRHDHAEGGAAAAGRGGARAAPDRCGPDFLVTHGYDEAYGARPLKRAIQRYIEDPLSEKILLGEFAKGDEIEVDAEKLEFRTMSAANTAP